MEIKVCKSIAKYLRVKGAYRYDYKTKKKSYEFKRKSNVNRYVMLLLHICLDI